MYRIGFGSLALVAVAGLHAVIASGDVPPGRPAPEISGETWINSPPLSLAIGWEAAA